MREEDLTAEMMGVKKVCAAVGCGQIAQMPKGE